MFKRILYSLGAILIIAGIAGGIISYSRGMRIDFGKKSLKSTGILSANSTPDGASIFIDGKLTSATNTSLTLSPGWYQVRITKEGYQSWEKNVRIQGEIVSRADALLLPANPSLYPVTFTGASATALSPSGGKVAYIVEEKESTGSSGVKSRTGVWLLELKNIPLAGRASPKQILTANQMATFSQNSLLLSGRTDWQSTSLIWSPDEKQMLILFKKTEKGKESVISAFQFATDNSTTYPQDVLFNWNNIRQDWDKTSKLDKDNLIATLPPAVADLLDNKSGQIKFSPDETRIFYQATASATLNPVITPPLVGSNPTKEERAIQPGKYYIYDLKEDKNFLITDNKSVKSPDSLIWFYDSKHIIMIEKDTISIIDYDGTNKRTVYTGPFENGIVYPWTSAGKIVILTNLNKPSSPANLYEIDLR